MSRIGKKPVTLPKGVKVTVNGAEAVVEGSKGKLSCPIPAGISHSHHTASDGIVATVALASVAGCLVCLTGQGTGHRWRAQ